MTHVSASPPLPAASAQAPASAQDRAAEAVASLWGAAPTDPLRQRLWRRHAEAARAGEGLALHICEPWWGDPRTPEVIEQLRALWLYSRVLDDAIDEGLPQHRALLLRAQPLLWGATQALARIGGGGEGIERALLELARESCEANDPLISDEPSAWGLKNALALAGPLCLSGDGAWLAPRRAALLGALWGVQAHDELQRAWGPTERAQARLQARVERARLDERLTQLLEGGWRALARRYVDGLAALEQRLLEEP